jgi:hypothetical protein
MHLEILNENMVGYANISARDMLDHLFETCGNITAVDLEINFEQMGSPSAPGIRSTLGMQKYLQQFTS